MQFQYNSDYPDGRHPGGGAAASNSSSNAREPLDFPPAQPVACARITTRVYHPTRNTIATVQNVLVRTAAASNNRNNNNTNRRQRRRQSATRMSVHEWRTGEPEANPMALDDDDDDEILSSSDDSDSHSDISDDGDGDVSMGQPAAADAGHGIADDDDDDDGTTAAGGAECAYWIQRTVREAIYGRVLFAIVLRKTKPRAADGGGGVVNASNTGGGNNANSVTAEWEVTAQHCAVKEMSWQHIRRERNHLAEDPVKEVSAMQFLKQWHIQSSRQRRRQQEPPLPQLNSPDIGSSSHRRHPPRDFAAATNEGRAGGLRRPDDGAAAAEPYDAVSASFHSMLETNVMMPLDLLSDERHLYSIMPYCSGGELFSLLDMNERFTEPEARYWMKQVLNVRYIGCLLGVPSTVDSVCLRPCCAWFVGSSACSKAEVQQQRTAREKNSLRLASHETNIATVAWKLINPAGPREFAARGDQSPRHVAGKLARARIRCAHY